jgi:hypothetical protein
VAHITKDEDEEYEMLKKQERLSREKVQQGVASSEALAYPKHHSKSPVDEVNMDIEPIKDDLQVILF